METINADLPKPSIFKRLLALILVIGGIGLNLFISFGYGFGCGLDKSKTECWLVFKYIPIFIAFSIVFGIWNLIQPWKGYWIWILIYIALAFGTLPIGSIGDAIKTKPIACWLTKEQYTCAAVAHRYNNPQYCELLDGDTTRDKYKYGNCYENLFRASGSKTTAYCFKMINPTLKNNCFFQAAETNKDKNLCDLIEGGDEAKQTCLGQFTQQTAN